MLQAGALLAGPALVAYGIDHGIGERRRRRARTSRSVVYLVLAVAGLFLGRLAIILVARIGESFLRMLRNRLFSPPDDRCRSTTSRPRRPAGSSPA